MLLAALFTSQARAAAQPVELSNGDMHFFMDVLRMAVQRAHHPTHDDREDAEVATHAQARQAQAYAQFKSAHTDGPTPSAADIQALRASDPNVEESAAIRRAHLLKLHPDLVVIRDRHLDEARYLRIHGIVDHQIALSELHGATAAKSAATRASVAASPELQALHEADQRNAQLVQKYLPAVRERYREMGSTVDVD